MSRLVDRPGECKRCTRPIVPGKKHCAEHLARQRARYRARIAAGECGRCRKPQVPGYHFCEDHLKSPGRAPRRARPPREEPRMAEPPTDRPTAPYVAWSAFLRASDALRGQPPERIDGATWPGLSNAGRSQTLSAFRFFGFIDHAGIAQPGLHTWIAADTTARQAMMADLLPQAYPEIASLLADDGSPADVRAAIERLGLSGDTVGRALTFFLKAADFAGLAVPDAWRTLTRIRRRGTDTRTYALRGGALTLTIAPNLLHLPAADRDFVLSIIAQLEAYAEEPGEA